MIQGNPLSPNINTARLGTNTMREIITSRGDGEQITLTPDELRKDIVAGTEEAAKKGKIDALSAEEIDHMVDIFSQPGRTVSVEPGKEVVVTDDGAGLMPSWGRPSAGHAIPISDHQALLMYERVYCGDTVGLGFPDYSYKPVKSAIGYARSHYKAISMLTTIPLIYGSQPNMGMYYHPSGPVESPSDYLSKFEFDKAKEVQEQAAAHMKRDIMDVAESLYEVGCEAMNLDTTGSAGDADFWGCLNVVEEMKEKMPDMPVEMGMAGEMVMGLHGELTYKGERLAGMFPHKQIQAAEKAGVDIFGIAVNSDTGKSTPYNLSRTVTFTKAASEAASIPIHANSGMGVCGMPMTLLPPIGCSTRCAKALVEIGKADGL
ncbi:MAG: [dimethylamine--corrinoid protein] Co-methyltransferase [Desulfobacteraceae bacterium]|nr:MAG: [dimethylamine--corrinoid protein] Co-methyltransferase [Desulfobacteraceae bacterium]